MKKKSNQRITKIKIDTIEKLLIKAEGIEPQYGTSIQPAGSDLTPYPDLDNLRIWSRDYLLKGINKILINKLSDDGQTYVTTLVDGLPLFSKLSKTITTIDYVKTVSGLNNSFTNSGAVVDNSGLISFSGLGYFSIGSQGIVTQGCTLKYRFKTPFSLTAQSTIITRHSSASAASIYPYVIHSSTSNIHISIQPNTSTTRISTIQSNHWYYIELIYASEAPYLTLNLYDDITKELLGSVNTGSTSLATTSYLMQFGTNACQVTGDGTNSYITTEAGKIEFLNYVDKPVDVPVETSKPGLLLSNLVAPVSNTISGSWLRHNLIHSNSSAYSRVNSDIIGNYSYSYLQRSVIHRTAGSTHSDNDSFCLHWSPSELGCIAHEAIIIPENNLRNTYTSYQSIVYPTNPDMQTYTETASKDVEFSFVDNNDNEPLTTTNYNGRVVGTGWTYEFIVKGNANGSSNDYGTKVDRDPEVDDGSNGICVEGVISYDIISGGPIITCTQTINSCFQTDQSLFNPDAPIPETPKPINNEPTTISAHVEARTCCGIKLSDRRLFGSLGIVAVRFSGNKTVILSQSDGTSSTNSSRSFNWYYDLSSHATCGNRGLLRAEVPDCGGGYCGRGCYSGTVIVSKTPEQQDNVNLYLNIIDLAAQYEEQGLPTDKFDCTSNLRFEVTISTQPCSGAGCTSKLIAENISINSLGDLSKFYTQTVKN